MFVDWRSPAVFIHALYPGVCPHHSSMQELLPGKTPGGLN